MTTTDLHSTPRGVLGHLTVEIDIPAATIESWIDAAGFGIRAWATAAVVDRGARIYTVTVADDVDAPPGPRNPVREYALTDTHLVSAACRLLAGVDGYRDDDQLGALRTSLLTPDDDQVDSDLADAIVQVAIYGNVIYG